MEDGWRDVVYGNAKWNENENENNRERGNGMEQNREDASRVAERLNGCEFSRTHLYLPEGMGESGCV